MSLAQLANVLPLLGVPNGRVFRRRAAQILTRMAEEGARSQAVLDCIEPWRLLYLLTRPIPERIEWAWRTLPTHYLADLNGDNWQHAWLTLLLRNGDCEDWAVLLAAILKALGVVASVGVMPGHAAVFVPLMDVGWPFVVEKQHTIPGHWPIVVHGGRKWLALEATTDPGSRGAPGTATDLIYPWLNSQLLYIADA